jgi:hypothetical protein
MAVELDHEVLEALAKWEETATGNEVSSVEQLTDLLQLPGSEAGRVARSVQRLVDVGSVAALNVTAMGSPYPNFLITGLTSRGLQALRNAVAARAPESKGTAAGEAPSFLGVRSVDITKNSRQVFVAHPYSIPRDDYRAVFQRVGHRFGVGFVYADERITNMHVLAKIYSMILESAFGIYDVSGWNANVTLELGISIGLRETGYILLNPTAHASTEAPADIRGFDRIEYQSLPDLELGLDRLFTGLGLRRIQ